MHYVAHVFHPVAYDLDSLYDMIEVRMAPYSEHLELEPYKDYVSVSSFNRAVDFYAKQGTTFPTIEEMLNRWTHGPHYKDDLELTDGATLDEKYTSYYSWSTYNKEGNWDYWTIGGRWSQYFNATADTVSVKEAWEYLNGNDQEYDWHSRGPYTYVTLDGEWISRELYNPDGVGYDHNDPNSIFPPNPDYQYAEYLTALKDVENLAVTVVDYHN